ncbi:MAG: Glycosyltransferase [Microgenomates group bacterium GW2011_GWA2_44_7]|nr:MAG: Glycosyltransferase [Microgenomates group bacterium GW2011_GWA2_44_7]KKT78428.1 MAG: Glycosyltransferase [Microgenomates group bacterium GW2011_GWB1_44_8]
MKILVIVPTYNEAENIVKSIEGIRRAFSKVKGHDLGIIVVDDTSPDGTADIVRDLMQFVPNLDLVVNKHKVGLGGAYLVAMAYAFEKKGADAVFEMDADLSHDPDKIPQMIRKLDEGYDLVLGSRYIPGGGIPQSWGIHRKFLSVIGNIVAMVLFTRFDIKDWTGGYRLLRRWVYEKFKPHVTEYRNYTFQLSSLYWALFYKAKVAEVPFHFVDRTAGKSKMPKLEYIVRTLLFIITTRAQEPKVKKFIKFGIVGFLGYIVTSLGIWILGRMNIVEVLVWSIATEAGIISNFTWNNLWTFKEESFTKILDIVRKFMQFNLTSAGALIITTITGTALASVFGTQYRQIYLPFIIVFLVLPYNWLMYTRIVWKQTGKK